MLVSAPTRQTLSALADAQAAQETGFHAQNAGYRQAGLLWIGFPAAAPDLPHEQGRTKNDRVENSHQVVADESAKCNGSSRPGPRSVAARASPRNASPWSARSSGSPSSAACPPPTRRAASRKQRCANRAVPRTRKLPGRGSGAIGQSLQHLQPSAPPRLAMNAADLSSRSDYPLASRRRSNMRLDALAHSQLLDSCRDNARSDTPRTPQRRRGGEIWNHADAAAPPVAWCQ
jgi:hypothetical protein